MDVEIQEAAAVSVNQNLIVVEESEPEAAVVSIRSSINSEEGAHTDKFTQTPGHVIFGKQGEVIIAQTFVQVQLIINDPVMQRFQDCDRHDLEQLTDITVSSLARLNWNGERILERAMTAFKLKVADEAMSSLLRNVIQLLRTEQETHRVETLVQELFSAFEIKLFGMDIESLVFILEHSSVDDANLTLGTSEDSLIRQRQLQELLMTLIPKGLELSTRATWTVGRYSPTEDDRRLLGGMSDSTMVSLSIRLAGKETEVFDVSQETALLPGKGVLEREISQSQLFQAASTKEEPGTELEDDDDVDAGGEDWLRGKTVAELENERNVAIQRLCEVCGPEEGRQPLRILFLGIPGAGKSSLINGIAAALSEERWNEYAYTGLRHGKPVTIVTRSFPKCCSSHVDRYRDVLLPTLIDLPGLPDTDDAPLQNLLRLLLQGDVDEEEKLMRVYKDCQELSPKELNDKYKSKDSSGSRHGSEVSRSVDCVVVVASPLTPLPLRLMTCIWRALRSPHEELGQYVPVFGVMTHKDRIDVTSAAFTEQMLVFARSLGVDRSRMLVCTNYCDDVDPETDRVEHFRPDLDLPLLRLMQQVCDLSGILRLEHVSKTGEEWSTRETPKASSPPSEQPRSWTIWSHRVLRAYRRSETVLMVVVAAIMIASPYGAAALLVVMAIVRHLFLPFLSPS